MQETSQISETLQYKFIPFWNSSLPHKYHRCSSLLFNFIPPRCDTWFICSTWCYLLSISLSRARLFISFLAQQLLQCLLPWKSHVDLESPDMSDYWTMVLQDPLNDLLTASHRRLYSFLYSSITYLDLARNTTDLRMITAKGKMFGGES